MKHRALILALLLLFLCTACGEALPQARPTGEQMTHIADYDENCRKLLPGRKELAPEEGPFTLQDVTYTMGRKVCTPTDGAALPFTLTLENRTGVDLALWGQTLVLSLQLEVDGTWYYVRTGPHHDANLLLAPGEARTQAGDWDGPIPTPAGDRWISGRYRVLCKVHPDGAEDWSWLAAEFWVRAE